MGWPSAPTTYHTLPVPWPLYRYAGDAAAGDTNGQGTGSVWYVVGADGQPIK